MPQHTIRIYDSLRAVEHASIDMPAESTKEEIDAAALGAKTAASQILARLGLRTDIDTVFIPNAMTPAEIDAQVAAAHETEAAGIALKSTDEILSELS